MAAPLSSGDDVSEDPRIISIGKLEMLTLSRASSSNCEESRAHRSWKKKPEQLKQRSLLGQRKLRDGWEIWCVPHYPDWFPADR